MSRLFDYLSERDTEAHLKEPGQAGPPVPSPESPAKPFSVWVITPDQTSAPIARWVDDRTAVLWARRLVRSIDARVGLIARVKITNEDDETCFEWVFGRGIIFPVMTVPDPP